MPDGEPTGKAIRSLGVNRGELGLTVTEPTRFVTINTGVAELRLNDLLTISLGMRLVQAWIRGELPFGTIFTDATEPTITEVLAYLQQWLADHPGRAYDAVQWPPQ